MIRGILKIRGDKEQVSAFITNCFQLEDSEEWDINEESDGSWVGFNLKNTSRNIFKIPSLDAFLLKKHDYPIGDYTKRSGVVSFLLECRDVHSEKFSSVSDNFQVDFHYYGFCPDRQENYELEIHCGEIIKNETHTFENYEWDSPIAKIIHN